MEQNRFEEYLDKYHSMYSDRNDTNKVIVTVDYLEEHRDFFEKMITMFTLYPDYLVDLISPRDTYFSLFFYQRVFLRVLMRYKLISGTFPRAYSKSFLNFIALIFKGMFLPRSKGFVCASTQKQAAQIIEEKVTEVFFLFPFLTNELKISNADKIKKKWGNFGKDYASIKTKNDSEIDIVNTGNAGRGGRRHYGTLEEFADADGDKINEVVIPLLNVDRKTIQGVMNPTEPHASQTMITTAGYKNTYAHDRTLEILVSEALEPGKAFCFGGDYRIPIMHGLLSKDKIKEKITNTSYKLESFLREYCSVWTGGSEESYYSYSMIQKRRKMLKPEFIATGGHGFHYVISCDVGRINDQTAIMVFKVHTTGEKYKTNLVHIELTENEHFKNQAARIKRLDGLFEAKTIVIDINGPGAGLADYMMDEQVVDGTFFPAYTFLNKTKYKKTEPRGGIRKLYGIEATNHWNSIFYKNAHLMLNLGRVQLLIDERKARTYFGQFKFWHRMPTERKATKLIPYILTTKLHDQLSNLRANVDNLSGNINVQKIKTTLGKDLASSFVYGLYYIAEEEAKGLKKRKHEGMKGRYGFLN